MERRNSGAAIRGAHEQFQADSLGPQSGHRPGKADAGQSDAVIAPEFRRERDEGAPIAANAGRERPIFGAARRRSGWSVTCCVCRWHVLTSLRLHLLRFLLERRRETIRIRIGLDHVRRQEAIALGLGPLPARMAKEPAQERNAG